MMDILSQRVRSCSIGVLFQGIAICLCGFGLVMFQHRLYTAHHTRRPSQFKNKESCVNVAL